tara:strand:- start:78 stop:494 length:417 start_codon:yes stop_codon:yes gene_type:complete
MQQEKNIQLGKNKIVIFTIISIFFLILFQRNLIAKTNLLEGKYLDIKVLDKVSSKDQVLKIKIDKEKKYKNLIIKPLKCKNSEFDDNPEIITYLQVRDVNENKNDKVFIFNGWMFSSSPSLNPFDHPVYDLWVIKCYN